MFEPWVGNSFGSSELLGGKRILVVGESHHSLEHPKGIVVPDLTKSVMEYYGNSQMRGKWMRTLDNVAWALSGKSRQNLAKTTHRGEFDVWQAVAFYNYIPVILTDGPRNGRPTNEHFQMAIAPFKKVLAQLKPEALIVCGYGLFPHIVRNHWPHLIDKPWEFKGHFVDVKQHSNLRVIRMVHPSTGFSHVHWHKVITEAIN